MRNETPIPEFEDEEPGAYLVELQTRASSAVWGALNLALILATRGLASGYNIGTSSRWYVLLRLLWSLLPVSCLLLLILTVWQMGIASSPKLPGKVIFSLFSSIAGLLLWLYLAFVLDVLPGILLRAILMAG